MAVWTVAAADREGHEQAFLDEVRIFHVVPAFRTAADLQRQVEDRMRAIAAEDLAPWCKLGNVVFRATEVEDRGEAIHVKARVRDGLLGARQIRRVDCSAPDASSTPHHGSRNPA